MLLAVAPGLLHTRNVAVGRSVVALRIRTKRVYERPAPEDGERLLVMRLWPRGIRKESVSRWEPELGPSRPLLKAFRSGELAWDEYAPAYLNEMAQKPELLDSVRRLASSKTVTLLCGCQDEERCHRTLLRNALENK